MDDGWMMGISARLGAGDPEHFQSKDVFLLQVIAEMSRGFAVWDLYLQQEGNPWMMQPWVQ